GHLNIFLLKQGFNGKGWLNIFVPEAVPVTEDDDVIFARGPRAKLTCGLLLNLRFCQFSVH
ncbi:hypothetical protein AMECASPLE_033407, partial [Ameca splendens]